MAKVTVKLFGVLRVDTGLGAEELQIDTVEEIFAPINARVDEVYSEKKKSDPSLEHPAKLAFKDMLVFINGERCSRKKQRLSDGDEIWILSPASGG